MEPSADAPLLSEAGLGALTPADSTAQAEACPAFPLGVPSTPEHGAERGSPPTPLLTCPRARARTAFTAVTHTVPS